MTESLARDGLTTAPTCCGSSTNVAPPPRRCWPRHWAARPNITGLVDGPAAGGFVTREPHPTDRRAVLVSFTEHGAAIVKVMDQGRLQLADLLFAGMPAGQFDCFAKGLGEVVHRLRTRLAEADG